MFLETLFTDSQYFIWWIAIVVFSVCLHELFHALAAYWQGDDTAKQQGYFTMNPMVHMGPVSLLILLLTGICWGACPVNPAKFRHSWSDALVSFAGPFANLLLMVVFALLLVLVPLLPLGIDSDIEGNVMQFLHLASMVNAALFILNMLPIPPLDGSKVWALVFPGLSALERRIGNGGFAILVLLFWLPVGFSDFFWGTAHQMTNETFRIFYLLADPTFSPAR